MARARNIKPGFFANEELAELPFEYRLLFIGTWLLADREGRLEDRPKRIKMALFPADNADVEAGLDALHRSGFILRYASADERFIQVVNFKRHQNPHHREPDSKIPAPESCTGQALDKPEASPRLALGKPEESRADSLIPDSLIPDSSPSGAAPSLDQIAEESSAKVIFDLGMKLLAGENERAARSMLGKLRKVSSDEECLATLAAMEKAQPLEPMSWLAGAIRHREKKRPEESSPVEGVDIPLKSIPADATPWDLMGKTL